MQNITALKQSIEKWNKIAFEGEEDQGVDNCALCALYYEDDCNGCPIFTDSGERHCSENPYAEWMRSIYAWTDKSTENNLLFYQFGFRAYDLRCHEAAIAMRDYLKGLLSRYKLNLTRDLDGLHSDGFAKEPF